jgi:nicotinamidase-related amidase
MPDIQLTEKDALIVVDVQKDFIPGGRLPVPAGDEVIPVMNSYIEIFQRHGRPVFATRDWHPPGHCSFTEQGGIWPQHCVADTAGAGFAPGLKLPAGACVISKGTARDKDAYSGFQGTDLDDRLKELGIRGLFIGGLALDVCVLCTVKDALDLGYQVFLLTDASRAVNVHGENGDKAIEATKSMGARAVTVELLS